MVCPLVGMTILERAAGDTRVARGPDASTRLDKSGTRPARRAGGPNSLSAALAAPRRSLIREAGGAALLVPPAPQFVKPRGRNASRAASPARAPATVRCQDRRRQGRGVLAGLRLGDRASRLAPAIMQPGRHSSTVTRTTINPAASRATATIGHMFPYLSRGSDSCSATAGRRPPPGRVGVGDLVYAGSDLLVMPSMFEPAAWCGESR